jgi:anti-sigma-K factor RskA
MSEQGAIHEERRNDIVAYVLGTLEEGERARVEAHLAACEPCTEYALWLQPAVDLLPASVEQLEPPDSLREGLMRTVRAEAAPQPTAAPARESRWRAWRGFALRPATGLAAAAVLAAGVFVGYGVFSDDGERSSVAAEAMGSETDATFAATVEYGAGGDAILHVERAPDPAPGDVYQAWVSRDGVMEPAASFRPEGGTAEAALGDTLAGADGVFVTEEPTPHETRPTSKPVLGATLD